MFIKSCHCYHLFSFSNIQHNSYSLATWETVIAVAGQNGWMNSSIGHWKVVPPLGKKKGYQLCEDCPTFHRHHLIHEACYHYKGSNGFSAQLSPLTPRYLGVLNFFRKDFYDLILWNGRSKIWSVQMKQVVVIAINQNDLGNSNVLKKQTHYRTTMHYLST